MRAGIKWSHGTTLHIHVFRQVVEVEIERASGDRYIATSADETLSIEASNLDRLVPLVRSSLFQGEASSAAGRADQLHFIYTRKTAA